MVLGVPVIFYFFGAGKMGGLALERLAAEPRRTKFSTGHSVPRSDFWWPWALWFSTPQ